MTVPVWQVDYWRDRALAAEARDKPLPPGSVILTADEVETVRGGEMTTFHEYAETDVFRHHVSAIQREMSLRERRRGTKTSLPHDA